MLALTRRYGESIFIGDDIIVTILGTKDGHTRIGIDAPKHVSIWREEIYKKIPREKTIADEENVEA